MSQFNVGDVVVVTGPLTVGGLGEVYLDPGEVGDVVEAREDAPRVLGRSSGLKQYIDSTSLTPFSEIAEDPEIDWGQVHDYVWDGTE